MSFYFGRAAHGLPGQLLGDRNPYPKAALSLAVPHSAQYDFLHGIKHCEVLQATSEQGLLRLRTPSVPRGLPKEIFFFVVLKLGKHRFPDMENKQTKRTLEVIYCTEVSKQTF